MAESEMSSRFISLIQSFWSNPLWGYGAFLLFLVIANKMSTSASWSNTVLAAAWLFFVISVARTPPLSEQILLSRVLWTALFASICGLVLYYTLWDESPHISTTIPAEISRRSTANQSYPGMSVMMLIKWGHLIKDRRQYIFDAGTLDRERLSLYVSPDNILTLFFVDTRSEPHVVQVPIGSDVLPVDRWVHLYCEVGSRKGNTKVRTLVNGNEIAELHLPYNTDTGKLAGKDNFVLAADLNHRNNGAFSVQHVAVWNVTLTQDEVDKLVDASGVRK